jgi:hypothetical protein
MSFWEDDVADMLADFGITVKLNPGDTTESAIVAIFDEDQEIINPQTGEVISASPALTCKSADVSGVSVGDSVEVNSVTYKIKAKLEDGTGITLLQLTEHL